MKLNKGDGIGIFSPSFPITAHAPKRYQRAKKFLESKGFKIIEGSLTYKEEGYRSGSIQERAEELNRLIRNPEVRCIMSTIGGSNSNALLPYIDYEAFKKDPKIIIGYSDVTAILFAIYVKTGIPTYYGPACVASFGELAPFNELHYEYFEKLLMTDQSFDYDQPPFWTEEYINWEEQEREKTKNDNKWLTLNEGRAEGRLIVANLNTLGGIYGSPYMIEIKKGDILLIEDSLKSAATVERSFNLLKLNGVFNKISGLIVGKHELYDDQGSGKHHLEILKEVIGDVKFPILAEVDCSHTHPMFTMEIGSLVLMDASAQKIKLLSKFGQDY
jgi:muramoyltetrapeptide carboxypeptidase LdcA involved in peptidoglycan recycling